MDIKPVSHLRFLLLILVLLLVWAVSSPVLKAESTPSPTTASTQPSPSSEREVTTYTLPPDKYEKAVGYSRARYQLYFISTAYGILVLGLVLAWGLAPRFRGWAESASGRRFVQVIVYVPLLLLTIAVMQLPIDVYGQWLSLKYDQSVQGWGSWAWDWTKGELVGLLIMTFVVWILYGIIRRSARRWWFYFWLASIPIIVFLLFISPVLIEPLFFKFEPLEKKQPVLVTAIEKVVQRGGLNIPRSRMFEMKASEKLKSINAYVTGFSASQRVVVWDTTISKMTIPQTLFVFGHEMGHYVLKHIPKSIAFISLVLLVFLYLGFRGLHWALGRWGIRWSIRGVEDYASLPVLMLLLSVFSFLAMPLMSSYSRSQEHDADVYGLEVTHGVVPDSAKTAAQAFQIMGEIDLADPNPSTLIKIWLYSHPPLNERIVFAHEYNPWSKGQPTRFVK